MLEVRKLTELHRRFKDVLVLSVYIDGGETDPAERTAWRRALQRETQRAAHALEGRPSAEREAFGRALETLEHEIEGHEGFLPSAGWVGFITEDGVQHSESLPIPVPTVVAWQRGALLTPYLRVLTLDYPAAVVLCDHRRARLFARKGGQWTEGPELEVDRTLEDFSDVNMMKSAHVSSGVRGATARDAARRSLLAESQQLVRNAVEAVVELTGHQGAVIIGGPPDVTSALRSGLPDPLPAHTIIAPGLDLQRTVSEVSREIVPLVDEIRDREQGDILNAIIDSAHPGGKGTLGVENTRLALDQGAVDVLLVCRRLADEERATVESLVGAALLHGGDVQELTGAAGDRLDTEGGVGARLRFPVL